jgi:hypothetical protein
MEKKCLENQRFGKLLVLSCSGTKRYRNNQSQRLWLCRCDCGNETTVTTNTLTRSRNPTRSCGCLLREFVENQPSGKDSPTWKGGFVYDESGYKLIRIPDHHRAKSNGYVREHIVVMEALLGRKLLPKETVHHKNGVKDDNRTENLELWSSSHPPGQRISDLVSWAKEIINTYGKIDFMQRTSG